MTNKYVYSTETYITDKGLKSSSAWLIPENSIILSNGATIGQVSINKVQVSTKQGIIGLIPKPEYNVEYLYSYMKSFYFRKELYRKISIGTIKTAYLRDINDITCYIPPITTQNKFVSNIVSLQEMISACKYEIDKLMSIKRYFMNCLFI